MKVRFLTSTASLLATTLLVLVVTACGGGKGSDDAYRGGATVLPQTTATSYSGPITGFGSVVVNGMRFATVGSSIADDDGVVMNASNLRLGSIVHVEGLSDNTANGTASSIVVTPSILGTVDSVDASNTFLTVMGRRVTVNASTNYYNAATGLYATLAVITAGSYVEVHGLVQADGSFLATLIEKRTTQAAYRLQGSMTGLNTTLKTFVMGALTVDYSTASVAGVLADNAWVKVQATNSPSAGVLLASAVRVQTAQASGGAPRGLVTGVASNSMIKVKGIAASAPIANSIMLAGVTVNLANAFYQGGTAASITAGTALEVKGTWNGSVFQASMVEFEGYHANNVNSGGRQELYGAVTAYTSNANFVVQGVTVNASGVIGLPVSIAMGTYLEVKGNMVNGVMQATRVELKQANTCNAGSGSSYSGYDRDDDDYYGGCSSNSGSNAYEIYGTVSNYLSNADFMLGNLRVNAATAYFEHGGNLYNGRFIEVKGSTNASGVFIATKVEVK